MIDLCLIFFGLPVVRLGMVGFVHEELVFWLPAGVVQLDRHLERNERVTRSVYEKDRDPGMSHFLDGDDMFEKIEIVDKEQGGDPRIELFGKVHHGKRMPEFVSGARIAAVFDNKFHLIRNDAAHFHYSGGAHGNAVQDDFYVLSEMLLEPVDPLEQILCFVQSEGDGLSFAFSVRALVDQKDVYVAAQIIRDEGAEFVDPVRTVAMDTDHEFFAHLAGREQGGAKMFAIVAGSFERFRFEALQRLAHCFLFFFDLAELFVWQLVVAEFQRLCVAGKYKAVDLFVECEDCGKGRKPGSERKPFFCAVFHAFIIDRGS